MSDAAMTGPRSMSDQTQTLPTVDSLSELPVDSHALPPVDTQSLRGALGRFATGVTIITCLGDDGRPVGLTANSFAALSLAPPLVLWSLRSASPSLAAFSQASHFVVNVLAETQVELSRRFASSMGDKFDEGQWSPGLAGAPVLAACAAVFECNVLQQQATGDHVLFIGRVRRLTDLALAPLLFQGGHYHLLGEVL